MWNEILPHPWIAVAQPRDDLIHEHPDVLALYALGWVGEVIYEKSADGHLLLDVRGGQRVHEAVHVPDVQRHARRLQVFFLRSAAATLRVTSLRANE